MSDSWQRLSAATAGMRRAPISTHNSVTYYLSPFQVPEAYRQVIDGSGDLAVEFRYPDTGEGTKEVKLDSGVVFRVGKVSSRLFEIRIPEAVLKASLEKSLTEAGARTQIALGAIRRLHSNNAGDNYRVAERLFETNMFEPAGT